MKIRIEFIAGLMFGFEMIPEYDAALIDIGLVRIHFNWSGDDDI